ncbi:ead/Ea22-like family protein [Citrobacter freundii]|uniref:ead/Ea22-like family protein n=1 Tax=Citrobacter freundii TaxID=546 RepID=UPI003A8490B1
MKALNKQALRERYSSQPVPKCHICGAEMTIQRAGGGSLVYGCTGRVDSDGEGYVFAEGRDFADNHYALSRVTVANNSDPDVLAMLDELEAAEHTAAVDHEAACSLVEENEEVKRKLEAAEKRIAEHNFENRLLANADRDIKALRERIAELEAVREVFLRVKALMYQSGGAPIENSLNPIDAWLYDAELIAAGIGVKGD